MMNGLLRIFIVDDEAPARNRLHDLLQDCSGQIPLQIVGEAENGIQALQLLAQTEADVVLLDIHMPGLDGMAVAEQLVQRRYPAAVIFTTAYDTHALQAFDLNARDYLLKPVRAERLLAALGKVQASAPRAPVRQHLSANERGRVLLVPVADIVCLRAEQKYVAARTATHTYLLEDSLTSLEQEFPQQFIRIHRNTLVARNAIAGFALKDQAADDGEHSGWVVLLKDSDECLPVSRRQYAVVKQFRQGNI